MKTFTLPLITLTVIATLNLSSCTTSYKIINNAIGTPGALRFEADIGFEYATNTLESSSTDFFHIFGQGSVSSRKNITLIVLTLQSMSGSVTHTDNKIFLSADYIASFNGDVKEEFTGIMYHEMARIRQWNGRGKTPVGLLTGIADFFRLKGGYELRSWVRSGEGGRWDEGYDVTARFLDYCDGKYRGFVSHINGMMEVTYSGLLFVQLTGKGVDELWSEYKVHHGH